MNSVQEKIERLKASAMQELTLVSDTKALEEFEIKYLGRKADLNEVLKSIKDIPVEERSLTGQSANHFRNELNLKIENLRAELESKIDLSDLDVTAPGVIHEQGHLHLTTQAIKDITKIFQRIGFYRVRYPEIEWDWYAFTALNFPDDHPARDDWETLFIDSEKEADPKLGRRLYTPHTSSGQIREMEVRKPPIRMINISKTGRRQLDVSHTIIFHQFEGLCIDEGINISNLKGTIDYFAKEFFGPDRVSRIRPYNFRFTEPSFEVDVSCGNCNGKGCRLCKEGWLEIGGAGMVHPNVLRNGGLDPEKYSGFAFGFGVERNAIMRAGVKIADLRLLYQNDVRFLEQF